MSQSTIPEPFYKGKVRDLYPVDESSMVIAASDRISAFDVVFDKPIPEKGKILNSVSVAWFEALRNSGLPEQLNFKDHLISADYKQYPAPYQSWDYLAGRSMYVKQCERIDFEIVVRGYLAGSGWKDYQKTGAVCGHTLPEGLRLADKLPAPILTPATKAPLGEHDENVSIEQMAESLGQELTERLQSIAIALFEFATTKLEKAGIILCDTKFEFGLIGDELIIIDEVLTPDSSRYWDAASYEPGKDPDSFDKQIIRNHLEQSDWNKTAPAPELPQDIIDRTISRYRELENKLKDVL